MYRWHGSKGKVSGVEWNLKKSGGGGEEKEKKVGHGEIRSKCIVYLRGNSRMQPYIKKDRIIWSSLGPVAPLICMVP